MQDPIETKEWVLVHKDDGSKVRRHEIVTTFRRKDVLVLSGTPPHKPSSTGRIYVQDMEQGYKSEFFPSVCGLEWLLRETWFSKIVTEMARKA